MSGILEVILFGFIGGTIRGLVGVSKALLKNKKIKFLYLVSTIVIAGIVGGLSGFFASGNIFISLLAGYAGIDMIESMYKMKFFKK